MLDTIRHLEVFSPQSFGDRRVDVVGVGATGSRIALALAKLGIKNIHLWDPDIVEAHNVPNQVFGNGDVGRLKVEALAEHICEETGTAVVTHAERVDGSQELGSVVFLLTDTMASRKEIWDGALKWRPGVELVIETRMGVNNGRVYTVNPCNLADVEGWEQTLYSDDVAETSACGSPITVGSTAEVVSGLAVWQLIRWHQAEKALEGGEDPSDKPESELVFSLQPMMIIGGNFND